MKAFKNLTLAISIMLTGLYGCEEENNPPGNNDDGIVSSVVKAPVAPDGNVAGQTTDLVLNLDASPDPGEPGFSLHTGDYIRVTLPDVFQIKGTDLPILNIFDCLGANLQCNAVVPLLGWPQGALGAPPSPGYELTNESSHTFLLTATEDIIPHPPANPGLKQLHLLLNSFANPSAGEYQIEVEVMSGAQVQRGIGRVQILPETQPSIEVTNAMHTGFANGNYQETSPDSLVSLPFDFLLWDSEGLPLEGVTIEGTQLMQGNKVIGQVSIEAPPAASGQEVFTVDPSAAINAPVTGIPVGHLRVFFRAGSSTGEYVATFELDGGNTVEMVVRVR